VSSDYGPEVSYSKNWVFPGDLLWYNRWNEILQLAPQFVEIETWNDYGESHYVGPLNSKHQDDGGSKWVNDMSVPLLLLPAILILIFLLRPHDGWLDMAKPYIAAYKAGASSVNSYIQNEQIIYWYRPTMSSLNCDATDTTLVGANNASGNYFMGRPDGSTLLADAVFAVTLLKSAGTLTVTSGGNTQTFSAPAGAAAFQVPMGLGRQSFALSRNGQNVLAGVSLRDISNVCPCGRHHVCYAIEDHLTMISPGIYNFNAFVGAVPPTFVDQMGPDALNSLTQGLHVSTCFPQPSLPTSAPAYTGPGGQPTSTTTPHTTTTPPTTTAPTTTTPPTTTTRPTTTTPPTTTSRPTTTTPPTSTSGGGCTITASSQVYPTNCLQPGCVWAGPEWQDSPDNCDGH
jgi:hypothetical protein